MSAFTANSAILLPIPTETEFRAQLFVRVRYVINGHSPLLQILKLLYRYGQRCAAAIMIKKEIPGFQGGLK